MTTEYLPITDKVVQIRLPEPYLKALRLYAEHRKTTMSDIIRSFIEHEVLPSIDIEGEVEL